MAGVEKKNKTLNSDDILSVKEEEGGASLAAQRRFTIQGVLYFCTQRRSGGIYFPISISG